MKIEKIISEKDYETALQRLEEIFQAKVGTTDVDEADVLALPIKEYEDKHFSIES